MRLRLVMITLALLLLAPLASAQDSGSLIEPADADMVDPLANISYPPPVYVVRGSVNIRGTANLPDLKSFYIEVRELDLSGDMEGEEPAWFPATLPRIAAVTDEALGTWNTASTPDGLYELRLMISAGDYGMLPVARVSPIRIENDPPEYAMAMMAEPAAPAEPAADDMPAEEPAAADDMPADEPADDMPAEEPAPVDPRPHIIVTVPGANVRSGDSLGYPIIYGLKEGDRAPIKGVSSWGTGWLFIELPSGRSGFIAPFIVEVDGDISDVAAIQPPPLPPTPIPPPPPATAIPPPPTSGANLVVDGGPRRRSAPRHLQPALHDSHSRQKCRHRARWRRSDRNRRLAA